MKSNKLATTNALRRSSTMGLALVALLLALALPQAAMGETGLSLVAGSAEAQQSGAEYKLGVGHGLFWDGPYIESARVPDAERCDVTGECYSYSMDLQPGGDRLRVALGVVMQDPSDVHAWADPGPDPAKIFELRVSNPSGDLATDSRGTEEDLTDDASAARTNYHRDDNNSLYAVEIFVEDPEPGLWTVEVVPISVEDFAFRMRAKLEKIDALASNGAVRVLSPNLRAIPPLEFNFLTPTSSLMPGAPTGTNTSCMAEEVIEAITDEDPIPELCLRFSMGIENAGEGPWMLAMDNQFDVDDGGDPNQYTFTQWQAYSDGSCCEKEEAGSDGTGSQSWHLHIHYDNVFAFDLLEVLDPDPELVGPAPELVDPTGRPTRKLGVESLPELMTDWFEFYQVAVETPYPATNDNGFTGLPVGWGDIYEWNRGGNYLDFPKDESGKPKPGYYVIRGLVDPFDKVIETDDYDNTSYALINVTTDGAGGTQIELIERGYGTDPWDPHKVVLTVAP